MLLVSYVTGMLFAIASAFSTTFMMFAVLRFFTGFCITGIVIVTTVLSNSLNMCTKGFLRFKLLQSGNDFGFFFRSCGVGGH